MYARIGEERDKKARNDRIIKRPVTHILLVLQHEIFHRAHTRIEGIRKRTHDLPLYNGTDVRAGV